MRPQDIIAGESGHFTSEKLTEMKEKNPLTRENPSLEINRKENMTSMSELKLKTRKNPELDAENEEINSLNNEYTKQ